MTYQPQILDADDLTAGGHADSSDLARRAGAVEDQAAEHAANDSQGNPLTAHDIFAEIDQ